MEQTDSNISILPADMPLGRLSEGAVRHALALAPALRPVLLRMVRRARQGLPQTATFSVQGLDYAAQGELERLLGVGLRRGRSGRTGGGLPQDLIEPANWRGVAAALGFDWRVRGEESVETFVDRLKLLAPAEAGVLDELSHLPEVLRQIRQVPGRESWKRIFTGAAELVRAGAVVPTTLSQLGSEWLNDSKALRSGALRRQLAIILAALTGRDVGERELFGSCGIVDNPYTSSVTVFAPFAFTTGDGTLFDYPVKCFRAGLACTLPGETVGRIREVVWPDAPRELTTSENAAPFARSVALGRSMLYTEGYPNLAVQSLLKLLGGAGVVAEHEGDADLDGFRIAETVGDCLPLRRVVAAEVVRCPGELRGIPLTAVQRARIERALAFTPRPRYADELSLLLQRGCWYEQESFPADSDATERVPLVSD